MSPHHIVLVPGFFGFGSLGELTYFIGVREALERAFAAQGLDVEVVEVPTLPTASIRTRAARVQETLARVAASGPGLIHIVGHSTGGLDARLAIAPTASLPTDVEFDAHERLRTLVSVNTPHFGTPLASFFGSAAGYPLLRLLAALSVGALRRGHLPLALGFRLGRMFTRADDVLGLKGTIADQFLDDVIADFSPARRAELIAFIENVSSDQSLIFQLTAAGCDLLNASTADPENVRYGSVVCQARPPSALNLISLRQDFYAQWMHALYAALHFIAGHAKLRQLPEPVAEQRAALERAFGSMPSSVASDAIVPTLSQLWGEVVHATHADHLDVVGHYGSLRHQRHGTDWLPSFSGFGDREFDALWSAVARFITAEAREVASPKRRRNVGAERTRYDLAPLSEGRAGALERLTAGEQAREALKQIADPPSGRPPSNGGTAAHRREA
jgi:triacylglycerol lipase